MGTKKDVTVPMDPDLVEQINDQLDYGDSRAEWIREAVRQRLQRDEGDQGNPKGTATAD